MMILGHPEIEAYRVPPYWNIILAYRSMFRVFENSSTILEKMIGADTIVMANHFHWRAIASPLKLLMDRSYSLLDKTWKISLVAGKFGAIVSCCASIETEKFTEPIVSGIGHYFSRMNIQLEDTVTTSAGMQEGIVM